MKTCMLTGIRKMEMRETPEPAIGRRDDVLVRMGAVGVCGSDVHYYLTGRIGSQVVKYPFPVGHECAGVVEAVGRAVRRIKPGDRVAIEPAMSCFKCDQCRTGRPHTCRKLRFLGCPGQADGCLSEFIVMPECCCFPVRKNTSLELAALAEPLSIGVYSVRKSVPMKGARIAILGSGPIGLSVLLAAKAAGCRKAYVTDKIPARLAMARKAGAAWTGVPRSAREVLAAEPLGLQAVFECCGEQEALDQAVDLLAPGGKLVLVGIPTVNRISFNIDKLRRKEISVQNIRRQVHCSKTALDMIERGRVRAGMMITHRFAFKDTQKAFDLVAGYRDGVVKAMIEFPGR